MRVTLSSNQSTHTVDCALFGYTEDGLVVLLAQRAVAPFTDCWVLPGGAASSTETLEETAHRVLHELAGVERSYLKQVGTYSDLDRHPVRRVITTTFYSLVRPEEHHPVAHQHVSQVQWVPYDEVPQLGFDHSALLKDAHAQLSDDLSGQTVAFQLLPERFTLTEVQHLYEAILGKSLDRPNFRRKMLALGYLTPTGEKKAGVRGGPALYRIDRGRLARSVAG